MGSPCCQCSKDKGLLSTQLASGSGPMNMLGSGKSVRRHYVGQLRPKPIDPVPMLRPVRSRSGRSTHSSDMERIFSYGQMMPNVLFSAACSTIHPTNHRCITCLAQSLLHVLCGDWSLSSEPPHSGDSSNPSQHMFSPQSCCT